MVLGGVEVHVVGHLERQVHRDIGNGHDCFRGSGATDEHVGDGRTHLHPPGASTGHERIEAGRGEIGIVHSDGKIDHSVAVANSHTCVRTGSAEDAIGEVVDSELGIGGDVDVRHGRRS